MNKMKHFLFLITTPIQKVMQIIKAPESGMTWEKAKNIIEKTEGGDVLLSYEKWHFTSLFIPGFWTHASIFNDKDILSHELKDKFVVEAVGTGVREVELLEWLFAKKEVAILRRRNKNKYERIEFGAWAAKQIGAEYDYEFSKDKKKFYCSELAADATDVPIDDIVTPDELSNMDLFYETIYSSRLK